MLVVLLCKDTGLQQCKVCAGMTQVYAALPSTAGWGLDMWLNPGHILARSGHHMVDDIESNQDCEQTSSESSCKTVASALLPRKLVMMGSLLSAGTFFALDTIASSSALLAIA